MNSSEGCPIAPRRSGASAGVELVEAQQQGQHDAAGGSQQALFGEGEAAGRKVISRAISVVMPWSPPRLTSLT